MTGGEKRDTDNVWKVQDDGDEDEKENKQRRNLIARG